MFLSDDSYLRVSCTVFRGQRGFSCTNREVVGFAAMSWQHALLLLAAGVAGGLTGSIAGLTSVATYPALLMAGLPPVAANVTNTVAMVAVGAGSTAKAGAAVVALTAIAVTFATSVTGSMTSTGTGTVGVAKTPTPSGMAMNGGVLTPCTIRARCPQAQGPQ